MKYLRLLTIFSLMTLLSTESFAALTQKEYIEVLKTVSRIYRPIAKEAGGNLSITGMWESNVFNASAERQANSKTWYVMTFGGLAR
ncbi:MAG: hypothetical protein K2Q18_01850, partial [Bdellovibrionales bacterium]|nr:hypothetical protein [Bdellovibrionales bacterium]